MKSLHFILIVLSIPYALGYLEKCTIGSDGSNWYRFKGHCYKFFNLNDPKTWTAAEEFCESQGGHLLSIENENENEFIVKDLHERNIRSKLLWTGLRVIGFDSAFKWSDGSIFDFTNWKGQITPVPIRQSSCVVMIRTGEWSATDCNIMLNSFVCKIRGTLDKHATEPPPNYDGNCPASWLKFRNKCYKLYGGDAKETYLNAYTKCRNEKSSLVSIHTNEEQDFLTASMASSNTSVWIGLSSNELSRKLHKWVDSTDLNFVNWAKGEPQYLPGEVCVSVIMHHEINIAGKWSASGGCSRKNGFICEKDSDKKLPPTPPETSNCSLGYERYRESCFKIEFVKFDANNAEEECQENYGHLASINDRFDQAFISALASSDSSDIKDVWIGFSQQIKSDGNEIFAWNNGWPVYYTNWDTNEPRQINESKLCVAMKTDKRWAVVDCSTKLAFVCRVDDNKPPTTYSNVSGVCPKSKVEGVEWIDLNNDLCYYLEQQHVGKWVDAAKTCSDIGNDGKLAIFHSQHDLDLVRSQINEINPRYTTNLWIGLVKNENGGYSWMDNSPAEFVAWDVDNPANSSSDPDLHKYYGCVSLKPHNMKFQSESCSAVRGFICEIKKIPIVSENTTDDDGHFNKLFDSKDINSELNLKTNFALQSESGRDNYQMGAGSIIAITIFAIVSIIIIVGVVFLFLKRRRFFPRYYNQGLYEEVHKLDMEFT